MPPLRDVLLLGGGHSHVQVLRRQLMQPLPDARLTVVVDRSVAVYSGMVPGVVAGQYTAHDVEIDVRPLAKRAGARLIEQTVVGVDTENQRVLLAHRPPLRYDLASFNLGSRVSGVELPGVKPYALPTRPIHRLVEAFEARARRGFGERVRAVVVGAGAGGVELAFCVRERLRRAGVKQIEVTLVDAGARILPGQPAGLARLAHRAAERRGITILHDTRVASVTDDAVRLDDGRALHSDLTLWVTGAAAPALFGRSGLPVDAQGFVLTEPTLQVRDHPALFAVGDCATLADFPDTPKAGVYAVRQGPFLADNLAAALAGRPLRRYRPQRDFLALLNLGDGTALGAKWGLAFEGAWVFRLKDRIDRRFMERFQVLDEGGAPASAFTRGMPPMAEMEMVCGGCAAKVGASALSRALSRLQPVEDDDVLMGLAAADDAVAVQRPGEVIVSSIDAFPAFTDDPWLVGRVAAVNALSDLHATGVAPRHALALVTVPEDEEPEECLFQVLAGARHALDVDECALLGGHTTVGDTLQVGFAVTGYAPNAAALWRNSTLQEGDRLVLTRALGTGVLFHADGAGRAAGTWVGAALQRMLRGNGPAAGIARRIGVTAATDVTGFGLAGHMGEMLRGAGLSATLWLDALPPLPGVVELLQRGERSTFHDQNREAIKGLSVSPEAHAHPRLELLFDPQTAGGLLLAVSPAKVSMLLAALHGAGERDAVAIGEVTAAREDRAAFRVVVRETRSGPA
ncbi:MAG: selenide, water dikinase SelD [Alphaproteobacteria bacterium]|nr:selenide, water dikinase SelD [Alphaproteobacteria bacterium]